MRQRPAQHPTWPLPVAASGAYDTDMDDTTLEAPSTAVGALNGPAERARVLASLRAIQDELRRRGVRRLRLFGSVARGEAGPGSDVDLIAEIDRSVAPKFSLIDLVDLEQELGRRLGRPVEVATAPDRMRSYVRAGVEQDATEVFRVRRSGGAISGARRETHGEITRS